jgi:hypothetical protein
MIFNISLLLESSRIFLLNLAFIRYSNLQHCPSADWVLDTRPKVLCGNALRRRQ